MKNTKTGLITIALLTTIMGGCSFFGGGEEATTPETPTPEETAQQPPTTPVPSPTVPFETPTVPKVSPLTVLTPATDPDARAKKVPIGIANPFVLMPKPQSIKVDPDIEIVPPVTPAPSTVGQQGIPSPLPGGGANPTAGGSNGGLAGAITTTPPSNPNPTLPSLPTIPTLPGSTTTIPPIFTPNLPPLPEPSLARGVQVTGMITIGSETKIILQAPNEPFSRYVKTGEYISDGQVLVKRIEGRDRGTPVIILEQFGIEVAKQVEAPSAATTTEASPPPPPV